MAKPKKAAPIKQRKNNEKKTPTQKPVVKPAAKKAPAEKHNATKVEEKKASAKKTSAKTAITKTVKKDTAKKETPPGIRKNAITPVDKPAKASGASKKGTTIPPITIKSPKKDGSQGAPLMPRAPKEPASPKAPEKRGNKRDQLRNRVLRDKKAFKPAVFTIDEACEVAKANTHKPEPDPMVAIGNKTVTPSKINNNKITKVAAPTHVKAASLADILGFNPKKARATLHVSVDDVPEKYRRYYKLLLDLRSTLTEGLSLHSEETLRRSTKDDAGDLSSYGQHMADAGTDTFDRDFALSMVANEQEALTEIDTAIKRIHAGTYGICEITQKPIAKERLLAVPFTRYSAEAQKDLEKNRMRVRTAAGLFGEGGEDGRGEDTGGGDDE